MKIIAPLLAATAFVATPAAAQQVGDFVYDTAEGNVGTVSKVEGDLITVKTDKHDVPLPSSSFREGDGKYYIAMTQAELNAAVDAKAAAVDNSVAVGKPVVDADLQQAGTIELIGPESVFVRLTNDTIVRVPMNGITPRAEGAVLGYRNADLVSLGVEMTPAQVQEALDASASADTKAEAAGTAAEAAGDAAVAAGEAAEAAGEAAAAAGEAAKTVGDSGAE